MSTKREGNADEHIRLPEDVKSRLDAVARYVAKLKDKKSVPYHEAVSFLIDKFEDLKNES
jgi:predicted DNA-binding protein